MFQFVWPLYMGHTNLFDSDSKESACNEGDSGSIPESQRSPGVGNGNTLQYSSMENFMDGRTWRYRPWVGKSWIRLSNWYTNSHKRIETVRLYLKSKTWCNKESDSCLIIDYWQHPVVESLSRVRLFVTPRTVARQAPLSMGISRQEYWRGVPLPSPDNILVPPHFVSL